MRILFFCDNFPPETNAVASRCYERALYWVKWGYDVTVVTSAPNFPEGKVYSTYKNYWRNVSTIDGIRVVRVKTYMAPNQGILRRMLDFFSYTISASFFALFEKKPDIIVGSSPHLLVALAGWIVSVYKRKPFVFELADIWPASVVGVGAMKKNSFIRLLERLELFLYRRADRIIALTHAFKHNLVSRGIDGEKIAVVRNGVDQLRYLPNIRNQELETLYNLKNKFVIAYIGNHGPAQGLDKIVSVLPHLTNHPNIHFLFVGDGAARNELIKHANVSQLTNITFVPRQDKSNIANYWDLCDVALISLSNNAVFAEVIPSKLFEAMAKNKPILYIGPEGEAQQIIIDEDIGICCLPQQQEKIIHAIEKLHNDKALYNKFTANTLHSVKNYSREQQAEKFIIELKKVVAPLC